MSSGPAAGKSRLRTLAPFLWCLPLLALIDFGLGKVFRYHPPDENKNRAELQAFLKAPKAGHTLILGNGITNALKPLEAAAPAGDRKVLVLSGGRFSSYAWFFKHKWKFYRDGSKPPERIFFLVQIPDFHKAANGNIPSILWSWGDFLAALKDGSGAHERTFLQYRMHDWLAGSTLAAERNERQGMSLLMAAARGRAFTPDTSGSRAGRASELNHILAHPDGREAGEMGALLGAFKTWGAKVTMVALPVAPSVDARLDSAALSKFDFVQKLRCTAVGADFIRIRPSEAGLADADYQADLMHFTEEGGKTLGAYLERTVLKGSP